MYIQQTTISSQIGLNVNRDKTKILKIKPTSRDPFIVNGSALDEVQSFTYLHIIINQQGGTDADVKARIGKARMAFLQPKKQLLKRIMDMKLHSLNHTLSSLNVLVNY